MCIRDRARAAGVVVVEADKRKLDAMSRTHAHQGVIALAAVREYVSVESLLERAAEKGENPLPVSYTHLPVRPLQGQHHAHLCHGGQAVGRAGGVGDHIHIGRVPVSYTHLFFGVPVCACLYGAWDFFVNARLRQKHFPVETEAYTGEPPVQPPEQEKT